MPTLRRARADDAAALAVVESASWRAAYQGILPGHYLRSLEPTRLTHRWRHHLNRADDPVWVAQIGAHVVGYSSSGTCRDEDMEPGFAGEIYELYVHPRLQGRGLGRDLMEQTWSDLGRHLHRWGVLWVLEQNHSARCFYERNGMTIDRNRRPYHICGHRVMAVRYARPLNPFDPLAALDPLPPRR